ncbi:Ger(x)C family spore germination protein [Paenibacillus sp. HWE-109]|uniref:Ger(x)C family spore germination protein n=1 Tax=Paenibacillus sp. HWE-109 TaxID=1306526 RepID=UPI001EDF3918|nr:Ger(x)C family spore germination protein [Paenibacillus sp. HWE-109]UKS25143.1 Ger(x)C family spore germination protein [Paenibacillus sp. HWE-109]
MKMKGIGKLAIGCVLLVSLTGCWDMKTIQDTNYLTALGFDYQKGKYIMYGQMFDFASVAKQEGGKSGQPPMIWVGREEGDTVSEAFNRLYKTTQQRVFWGHVNAYLFSKEALKQGIGKFTDGSVRFGETRFTQWIYSTDEPIEDVLSVIPFFNTSPMSSIMMQPVENYRQRSVIRPYKLYRAAALLREPGYTLMMPSLAIRKDVWLKNDKPDSKLEVNGVYALGKKGQVDWLSEDQFIGGRWLEKSTARTPLVVYMDGKAVQTVSILKPNAHIKPRKEDPLTFDIAMKCKVVIAEVIEKVDEQALQKQIDKEIADEITYTFELGKKKKIDVYQLEHVLYRQDFPEWAKVTANGEKLFESYQLGDIQVKTEIVHSGMLKNTGKPPQY